MFTALFINFLDHCLVVVLVVVIKSRRLFWLFEIGVRIWLLFKVVPLLSVLGGL